MTDSQADSLRRAIEVLTAWTESTDFQRDRLVRIVEEEGQQGLVDTAYGLVTLCGVLLTQRERETGRDGREQLQRIAVDIPKWLGQ